jgi:CheY-like chemotaxis protein
VRQRPDLVRLDLQMPNVGGLVLLRQIRDAEPWLPVIVISATQRNEAGAEALKAFDPRHVELLVATFLDSGTQRPPKPGTGAR